MHIWVELFQGVVLDNTAFWLPRLIDAINHTLDAHKLHDLVRLIHFDGSLVVFRFPEAAKAFLRRAEELDGPKGLGELRSSLHIASGPGGRSFVDGKPDEKQDYLEAEAGKAATQFAGDPLLGPFYRWIVEIERHMRTMHKRRYEAEVASLEE